MSAGAFVELKQIIEDIGPIFLSLVNLANGNARMQLNSISMYRVQLIIAEATLKGGAPFGCKKMNYLM